MFDVSFHYPDFRKTTAGTIMYIPPEFSPGAFHMKRLALLLALMRAVALSPEKGMPAGRPVWATWRRRRRPGRLHALTDDAVAMPCMHGGDGGALGSSSAEWHGHFLECHASMHRPAPAPGTETSAHPACAVVSFACHGHGLRSCIVATAMLLAAASFRERRIES